MRFFDLTTKTGETYGLATASAELPSCPASAMTCSLAPGQQSHGHNHSEYELFWFTSGPARVSNGSEEIDVPQGHAILFAPFEPHIIENPDTNCALEFLSLYWSTKAQVQLDLHGGDLRDALVFATPPTPNGDLHLGHLSGPYLAGDVLARALRQQGRRVWYGSGRDDHQTYVPFKAQNEGSSAQDIADTNARLIRDTWKTAGIAMDGFTEPDRNGAYANFVREGIARLVEKGLIVERETPAAFDSAGTYLHEAFIQGKCPHCGDVSDGNACETCGRPNDCADLTDARVRSTLAPPLIRPEKRLYFRLSALADDLAQYVRMAQMPAKVQDLCSQMLEDGLPDICISHPGTWGIRHSIEGHEDSIVYVWFEMAFGYLWQAAESRDGRSERWARVAQTYDGSRDIVHAYGFDNAYYHALLFPAVYLGLDIGLSPPRHHVVNELLDLDGSKFSTSRGHLIWARDFLADVPVDYTRFALSHDRPEGVRANFIPERAIDLVNQVFAADLAQWIAAVSKAIGDEHCLPETGAWAAEQRAFLEEMTAVSSRIKANLSLEGFSPRQAARHIRDLIALGARFADTQSPFLAGSNPRNANHRRTSLALLVHGLRLLAEGAAPIMPEIARALHAYLGTCHTEMVEDFLPGGHRINVSRAPRLEPVPAVPAENPDAPSAHVLRKALQSCD